MLKRELKVNLKSFIIWTSILIGMFLVVFIVYPYIITDDSLNGLDQMMKVFPKELLKAFNMDITSINTVYGWLKSEGFMFVLIIVGIYSSMLGSSIVLKEESDKTIEYLNGLPLKRRNIMFKKILASIFYITLMVVIVGIFNYIGLTISGDFSKKQYLLLSITPLLIGLPLFAINLFISTFRHKTKKVIGISLGMVFLFYFLQIISDLGEKTKVLRYFTIYTLADTRNIVSKTNLNPVMIIISLTLTLLFIGCSFVRYEKKELV